MDILYIRPTVQDDLTALNDLFAQFEEDESVYWDFVDLRKSPHYPPHNDATSPVFVAQKGQIIGCGCLLPFPPCPAFSRSCALNICVREDKREQGFGRALLDYALSEAARLGYHVAVAMVHMDNARALELFRRSGFLEDGHLPQSAYARGLYQGIHLLHRVVD